MSDQSESIEPQPVRAGRGLLIAAGALIVLMVASIPVTVWVLYHPSRAGYHHVDQTFASAGEVNSAPSAERGRNYFATTCITCHGQSGAGVPHMGANLLASKFIPAQSDQQLADYIKSGRLPNDPNSVLGMTMQPKGGNPSLDDAAISDIVCYLRTLRAQSQAQATIPQN